MYMPGIVDARVERWLLSTVPPREGAFGEIEAEAIQQRVPCIGPYEGHVLMLLATIAGARRILEVGTATGYSALWLAKAAAASGGTVTTIERDTSRAAIARANAARCGFGESVRVLEGEAFTVLPGLTSPFDFIFLDIVSALEQPSLVERLFTLSVERLAPGGLLVSDNALHAGNVAAEVVPEHAQRYAQYNRLAFGHPELETAILPVRDGLAVSRRRAPAT